METPFPQEERGHILTTFSESGKEIQGQGQGHHTADQVAREERRTVNQGAQSTHNGMDQLLQSLKRKQCLLQSG